MATVTSTAHTLGRRAQEMGLEPYVLELELDGLTILPLEVTGVSLDTIDELTQLLLDISERAVGCKFSLDRGPHAELDVPDFPLSFFSKERGDSTQFQLQCLAREHRLFRDLAVRGLRNKRRSGQSVGGIDVLLDPRDEVLVRGELLHVSRLRPTNRRVRPELGRFCPHPRAHRLE